jgi:signal transduction histidine kinase
VDAHPASGRIHARLPALLPAEVDAARLERILVNLLDNAAKYAPDGDIEVALTSDGSQLRLEVTDTGPGIPPEELERVFLAFHRVDEHHPQPGTGIGLALVREFSQLHAGRAWAVDTEGDGAHLCVELPLVATSGASAD